VRAIAADDMANFAMRASPEPTLNAFVPLGFLQKRAELAGKINVALLAGVNPPPGKEKGAVDLHEFLSLRDWGLKLLTPDDRAKNFFRFLDPSNKTGELRRARWKGRVPDDLALRADAADTLTLNGIRGVLPRETPLRAIAEATGCIWTPMSKPRCVKSSITSTRTKRSIPRSLSGRFVELGDVSVPYVTVAAVRPDQMPGVDLPNDALLPPLASRQRRTA